MSDTSKLHSVRTAGLCALLASLGLGVLAFSLTTTGAAGGWQVGGEASGAGLVDEASRTAATDATPGPRGDTPPPKDTATPSPTRTETAPPTDTPPATTTPPETKSATPKPADTPPPAPPIVAPELQPVAWPSPSPTKPPSTETPSATAVATRAPEKATPKRGIAPTLDRTPVATSVTDAPEAR